MQRINGIRVPNCCLRCWNFDNKEVKCKQGVALPVRKLACKYQLIVKPDKPKWKKVDDNEADFAVAIHDFDPNL